MKLEGLPDRYAPSLKTSHMHGSACMFTYYSLPHRTRQTKQTKNNTNKKQCSKMISTYITLFLCKYQGVLNVMLA